MQVKASSIKVHTANSEEKEYTNVSILLSDFGVYIKEDNTLRLFPWEKVLEISWDDMNVIERVWAEAVLETLEDFMDEDFMDELEEEEAAPPAVETTPEKEAKPDDPESNPYN
jgi:hypothetical protein